MKYEKIFSVTIATIFPELFPGPLKASLVGKGLEKNIWSLNIINIRDYGIKGRIDHKSFGGLPGMIITAPTLEKLIEENKTIYKWNKIFYTNPKGTLIEQNYLKNLLNTIMEVKEKPYSILIICGRYEGIDARLVDYYSMEQISIGNFILSGGEVPAMAFLEGLIRLLPNILGNQESTEKESFSQEGYLQSNRYTKPREWKGIKVPEVLLSGNHKNIKKYQ